MFHLKNVHDTPITNIVSRRLPLHSSLNKVLKLQGVRYEWKTKEYAHRGFTGERQIGLIAQEVEEVLPELVRTERDGNKALSYEKIVALMSWS